MIYVKSTYVRECRYHQMIDAIPEKNPEIASASTSKMVSFSDKLFCYQIFIKSFQLKLCERTCRHFGSFKALFKNAREYIPPLWYNIQPICSLQKITNQRAGGASWYIDVLISRISFDRQSRAHDHEVNIGLFLFGGNPRAHSSAYYTNHYINTQATYD